MVSPAPCAPLGDSSQLQSEGHRLAHRKPRRSDLICALRFAEGMKAMQSGGTPRTSAGTKVGLVASGSPLKGRAIKCPKCTQTQQGVIQCESCRAISAKLARYQARLETQRRTALRSPLRASGFGWGAIAVTAIISAAVVWIIPHRS